MQYLAVLGRLPKLSLAELESLFDKVTVVSDALATFAAETEPDINRLGGTLKLARPLDSPPLDYLQNLPAGKIVLGISDYNKGATAAGVRREAMRLKKILVRHGRSVRILANQTAVLSTATCHHNQLGQKPLHVELLRYHKTWYLGLGVQNITAYAQRDQARPARDAKVGMLPPKLAQILVNLCGELPAGAVVLDPFCGTGVVLQEAYLMGYTPYGTDVSERMVEYTKKNLAWLATREAVSLGGASSAPVVTGRWRSGSAEPAPSPESKLPSLAAGDARDFTWRQPIDAVACEAYLGPPLSQVPSEPKLRAIQMECKDIIVGCLKNLATQLESGTPLALAIPAWRRPDNSYARLDLLDEIAKMGYNVKKFKHSGQTDLLYLREGQVVAREVIVLRKK